MAKGRKTGGRQPGSANKVTVAVKEAIERAFDDIGGAEALAEWGRANPTPFYQLWGKLLPSEVKATLPDGMSFTVVTGVPRSADPVE